MFENLMPISSYEINTARCTQMTQCWDKTHINASEHCGDAYKALVECLDNNERRSLKCAHLRPILEECYVGKVILKK